MEAGEGREVEERGEGRGRGRGRKEREWRQGKEGRWSGGKMRGKG